MKEKIDLLMDMLKKMPDFDRVKFVFLFGSQSEGKANLNSDYDFAVYYDEDKKERFKFRMRLLGKLPEKFDVHIYQDLPLYVQQRVLKGNIIYAQDMSFVYATAYQTIKLFEYFKKRYYDYIKFSPPHERRNEN